MKKLKLILLLIFQLSIFSNFVDCKCLISIAGGAEQKPIFRKRFGTRFLKISKIENNGEIEMFEGEHLTAFCATEFETITYFRAPYSYESNSNDYYYRTTTTQRSIDYYEARNISLRCDLKRVIIWNLSIDNNLESPLICKDYKWKVYETKRSLPWCSSESTSYILASNINEQTILGSLCYRLEDMALESMHYITQKKNFKLTQNVLSVLTPSDLHPQLLNAEVDNFDDVFRSYNEGISQFLYQKANDSNNLLKSAVFIDDSILQTKTNQMIFKNYQNFLNITWWHNLKYGNWRRFIDAFEKRSSEITYEVFLGVSGSLRVPLDEIKISDGKEFNTFKFQNLNSSTPEYIWTYLRTLDKSEEFVFISFNSPFSEFFNSTDVTFCEDICHKIDWLKNIRTTFRYSTLGISFCCTPESVRNSNVLKNFPRVYNPTELIIETTTPTTEMTSTTSTMEQTSTMEETTTSTPLYDE